MRDSRLPLIAVLVLLAPLSLEGTEIDSSVAREAAGLLERTADAAHARDWDRLLEIFLQAHLSRGLHADGRRLFYQGALVSLENLCSGEGDDLGSREILRLAFLAGKYAGLAQRHLYLAESAELTPVGWGAGLAAESAASYYFLGRLMEMEQAGPGAEGIVPAERQAGRNIVHLVYFAAALRHWLGLDSRLTAEAAVVLDEWLRDLAEKGISFSFDYLRDLATSPGLRDASVPGDAPLFYRFTKMVDDRIVSIVRKKPEAIMTLAASERYAFPRDFRWLEPAGLALEHISEAGGLEALDNIREQLSGLRAAARPAPRRPGQSRPDDIPHDG